MLIINRQQRLIELLRDQKTAELEDLARQLEVSGSTIRRDLEALEKQGVVARTHGGAIYRGEEAVRKSEGTETALTARMGEKVEAKQAIARYAASLVQPNMTLLLDGGSTVIYACHLIVVRPLQVVTNSLAVAGHFADDKQVEVTLVGGRLYPRTGVMIGPIATGCLADLHADLCLFSAAAVHEDAAYNINLDMARVEQVMIQQAARSILLMDSSKFGRMSLVRICSLGEVDRIVTDEAIDPSWTERLGERLVIGT